MNKQEPIAQAISKLRSFRIKSALHLNFGYVRKCSAAIRVLKGAQS